METTTVTIPDEFMQVKYNGAIIPDGKVYNMLITGANCQVFAYHILRAHQFVVPEYRSSELWVDIEFSEFVTMDYRPLDILFFHKKNEAYGAHIAVYIGDNKAIHLSKKVGVPVIWTLDTFFQYPRYAFLLGGKRFFKKK